MRNTFNNGTTPDEIELVNLADYSHPKLLDTSQVPSFDDPEAVEKYFAKVEMNYVFLRVLMKFHLNIDDDEDTARADDLLMTIYFCEGIMSRMLKKLYLSKKISENTLLDTKDCLFDLLIENPELIEWYTDLAAESSQERRDHRTADQDSIVDSLLNFLDDTNKPLGEKLWKILLDKLCGSSTPSDSANRRNKIN